MPVVIEYLGLKFKIHVRDHAPPHVHVEGSGKRETRIHLLSYEILSVNGFSRNDLKRILEIVHQYSDELKEVWNEYHE